MQRKYHEIYSLAGETVKKVTADSQEWMKYLATAARIYKFSFEDQILIYAQKPETTACASIKIWNEKMFCWVNRGAKGIALIDAQRDWPVLHYVFDVSDVHPAKRIGKKPYLWKMETEHEEAVLEQLEKTYGETEGSLSFEGRIMELAMRIAGDYCEDLMPEIDDVKAGSFLEELDELNVEIRLRDTLSSSIAYTLLSRCGADMETWAEELNFDYISDFSTPKIISVLGTATSELCRPILVDIGKTILGYNKKIAKEPDKIIKNNPEKGLEKREQEGYNYNQTNVRDYRKEDEAYATDLRENRGLSGSEPDSGRANRTATHEIRQDAEEISERTPEGDLQRDVPGGRIAGTLPGDTGTGRAEDGLSDGTDGEVRGSGREAEGSRSDAVGGEDEQHPPRSGGKRNKGTDLHISEETELNSKVSEPDQGENTLSGSFLDNLYFAEKVAEIQKGILCSDAFLIHKRPEIAGYFAMEQDTKRQTEYFKNSFRMGMTYVLGLEDSTVEFHAEEDGIYMRDITGEIPSEETLLSWENARFFVNSYIEDGVYLLPGEVAEKIETKGMYQQLDIFSMFSEQVGTIAMAQAEQGEMVSKVSAGLIPEEWVETILRSGGGRENNRKRIYAKYQQGKNAAEMVAFLRKEYGETGKGFEFDGVQVSAWFDESGMTVSHGTSALENPELKMNWWEIEKKIRSQVENGTYMDANEIYLIDDVERNRIATYTAYFFYDGMGEMPEEIFQKVGNRSDAHAKMVELLSEPEGIRLVTRHMDDALQKLASGEKKLRFRSAMPKEELREELDNLLLEKHTFPVAETGMDGSGVDVRLEDFITMDEIDRRLGKGSSFHHGEFRIYEYFQEGHDSKETVAFLKNEYGTGGQSHALPGVDYSYEDHDAKGIRFRKGCITNPYVDVLLSWKVVEKRIRKLITQDRYLSPEGKEAYARYQEEQAQKRLVAEKERLEYQTKIACKEAVEKAIADHFDGYHLADDSEKDVIQEFGTERVSYVLAYTVSCLQNDGRFSEENKEWAKGIEPKGYGHAELIISSHPAVLDGFIAKVRKYIEREKEQKQEPGQNDVSDVTEEETEKSPEVPSITGQETVEVEIIPQTTVAIETSDDYAEPEFGFYTHQYADGRDGTRYRLVEMDEDGYLVPYLPDHKFFLNRELIQEYIDAHGDVLDVISYDDMVYDSIKTQEKKEISDPIEGITEERADADALLKPKQDMSGHNVQTQEEEPKEQKMAEIPLEPKKQETAEATIEPTGQETTEVAVEPVGQGTTEVTVKSVEQETTEVVAEPAGEEKEPALPTSTAVNFRITDDIFGVDVEKANTGFSPKEKFRRNIEAIRTLKKIEGENRIATPEEQKILSQYVGWGGLADAFDERKNGWGTEYQQLKELLSPEEYRQARESTLNAYYTSLVIIRSIYETLDHMGFSGGNILEPSMGIGNFFGMLPESMCGSSLYGAGKTQLYGVELDDITGRIAKQLYPGANIQISGFEKTDFPNNFFDVAVGNVPFGQYKVADRQYDKHNFLIHDYFFAKTLDKVRPGGIIAFVTSKGTMDKKSPVVRRYLAQRAELLGAVRLPNTAFKENAGTEVTSDILFLKKRDRIMDIEPDWVYLSEDENGISMNSYFVNHPGMIVGKMAVISGQHGEESACLLDGEKPFAEQLRDAVFHIDGEIEAVEPVTEENEPKAGILPADPSVKNYSYTLVDDRVYYREDSVMLAPELPERVQERIRGMVKIRDCTQKIINLQLEEYPEDVIKKEQEELNRLYDSFTKKHGLINSRSNKRAFSQDSSYCLLCSLEKQDDEGNFVGKADMFTKRTIKKAEVITSVDTASEALVVSLSEKAGVDLDYMAELTGKKAGEITEELKAVIFQNPVTDQWEAADEYLSGNVREKLETARVYAENHPEYAVNVQALTQVQPKELDASEIEVRIGATWIEAHYMVDFMRDTFETPQDYFDRNVMAVLFSDVTGEWRVKGKNADYGNSLVNTTYGTDRRNAYQILEDSLNLKDSRVYDTVVEDGKEKRVLNKKETMIASQKQEMVREAFKDWIFRDPERREMLVAKYNKIFNSTRPREYDGSHLNFPGMTPDIELKPHQKNAVAHILYGNNTLLAHCVGAGKTFEMTAAAMESKRLGLCQKSLFVVPNHLTEQWASDFLRLYPGANILAATKKDFEPANRKKFCSRIATGEYDAVIIGHSQFEKVPLSKERQIAIIERQMDEIAFAIEQAEADNGERYTIKQMEKTRKSLQTRLDKLNDASRKDNVVTFEQLGVDRLFVDESHFYKNLFLYTKMRNVAGIAQSEAQKSSDMFAKCQYLDELTGGKGVTFATGTPISNSMTELYTNMRYLQYSTLQRLGLGHFDSWAASFGETQTAIELAPEGTGYRAKTRFAKFFNLPELIALFKECADIQTADMLELPVPDAEYENVVLKPSEYQQEMVASLADRAETVRNRLVQPDIDNMLKITSDGRKLALDQRLVNDMLPDAGESKAAVCVENAFQIWEETKEQHSTQLIFCDLSTPKGDGSFNVYEDVRAKLMEKGVPEEEIAFIHTANTETRKAELFAKIRSGQIRFLLGSTQKMGAGTNVQDRLIALHHLDVPWRPSDVGRILRTFKIKKNVEVTDNGKDDF
jgi:N12 class adenine-specific DNA methylase/adenine-specific DNA methylase